MIAIRSVEQGLTTLLVPNTFAANVMNIVFGSTSAVLPSALTPSTSTNATGIIV